MHTSKVIKTELFDPHTLILTTTKPDCYNYQPGQYTKLTVPHANPDNRGESRDFSYASHPVEDNLIFISRIPDTHSSYKAAMKILKSGDEIFIDEPRGHFLLPESPETSMIWLAAGVGIAPFRSFIKSNLNFSNTTLFYTNPNDNYAFLDDIKHLNLVKNNSKISGHFTESTFSTYDKNAMYYLCGNTSFILSVQKILLSLNIKPNQFRKDVFTGY